MIGWDSAIVAFAAPARTSRMTIVRLFVRASPRASSIALWERGLVQPVCRVAFVLAVPEGPAEAAGSNWI